MDITSAHRDQPTLTYYREGDRVELSMRTLLNWRAKFANFFRNHIGAEAGDTVAVTNTSHWLVVPLIAAAGDVDITVYLGPDPGAVATLCDIADAHFSSGGDVFVCSDSILGDPLPSAAPVGTEDLLEAVRIQPDQFAGSLGSFPPLLGPGDTPIDPEEMRDRFCPDIGNKQHVLIDDCAADRTVPATLAAYLSTALGIHVVWVRTPLRDLGHVAEQERCEVLVHLSG